MAIPSVTWDIATLSASPFDYATHAVTVADIASVATASSWPIGTVDADGTDKAITTFLIWNNKGGSSAASDMEDCTLTVVDAAKGNTGAGNCTELLGGGSDPTRWIHARCDSAATIAFTQVGSFAPATIESGAIAIKANSVGSNIIKGDVNDGNFATVASADNFSINTLKVNVPVSASAGAVSGYIRVAYRYV